VSLKISHVLIDVYDLLRVLLKLRHKTIDKLCELWEFLLDYRLIFLVLPPNVSEELFEMLRVIHNQLVNDGFVKVNAREFIRVAFDDYCSHSREMLRD